MKRSFLSLFIIKAFKDLIQSYLIILSSPRQSQLIILLKVKILKLSQSKKTLSIPKCQNPWKHPLLLELFYPREQIFLSTIDWFAEISPWWPQSFRTTRKVLTSCSKNPLKYSRFLSVNPSPNDHEIFLDCRSSTSANKTQKWIALVVACSSH